MDFIMVVIAGCFIALLLAVAITFGFTLLMIILATAALAAILTILREVLRRWLFVRHAARSEARAASESHVIEGNYEDITYKDQS